MKRTRTPASPCEFNTTSRSRHGLLRPARCELLPQRVEPVDDQPQLGRGPVIPGARDQQQPPVGQYVEGGIGDGVLAEGSWPGQVQRRSRCDVDDRNSGAELPAVVVQLATVTGPGRVPAAGRRQSIDPDGADPVWRPDGREIVYLKGDAVWAVSVSAADDTTVRVGTPQRLFGGLRLPFSRIRANRGLDVSADGSRFYVIQRVEQPKQSDVIHVQLDVVRP